MTTRCWAVVTAAGSGRRMKTALPKQYLPLAGKTVLEHSLGALLDHPRIDAAVLVLDRDDERWPTLDWRHRKPLHLARGGVERHLSVLNGLELLSEHADARDWALVHDAARPCLHATDLDRLIDGLATDPVGGLLATRAKDTVKRADSAGLVSETLPRDQLWHAQTPQMFRLKTLLAALRRAVEEAYSVTDEAAAIEQLGLAPQLIEGRADNIKITHPEDLAIAELLLERQRR